MKWSSSWFLLLLLFLQPGAADEVRESNLKHLKSKGFRVASSLPASSHAALQEQAKGSSFRGAVLRLSSACQSTLAEILIKR